MTCCDLERVSWALCTEEVRSEKLESCIRVSIEARRQNANSERTLGYVATMEIAGKLRVHSKKK